MAKENRQYGNSINFRLLKWLHPLLMMSAVMWGWGCFYAPRYAGELPGFSYVMLALAYTYMLYFLDKVYHALAVGLIRVSEMVYSQFLAILVCDVMAYMAGCLYCRQVLAPIPAMLLFAGQFLVSVLWSVIVNRIYYAHYPVPKTAILYKDETDLEHIHAIYRFAERFDVTTLIENPKGDVAQLYDQLKHVQVLFVSGIDFQMNTQLAKYCVAEGKRAYFLPTIDELILCGAEYMPMFSEPVMKVQRAQRFTGYLAAKRMMDLAASVVGLIVASPIMIATAIAIKCGDGGPVFYRQKRLTLDGKEFSILKFRSMKINAEKDGVARLASANDDRITKVGHFIRSTRIDELPQLINILMGDMSLVGPRPERPEIAAEYERTLPEFALRLQVRAGLTGMAQVYGRYNTDPLNKLKMDLIYINRLSPVTDFRLLFATVKILFLKESTAGVPEGQKTAKKTTDHLSKSA